MSSLKISYATFVQFVRPLSAPDNGHHFSSSRFTVMTRLSINCSTCYSCDDTWFALEITGVHCMFILISFWFSHVSDPKGNWKREVYTIKNRDASERLLGPIEKAYLEFPGQKPVQVRQEEVRSSPPNAVVLHTVVQVWYLAAEVHDIATRSLPIGVICLGTIVENWLLLSELAHL